MNTRKGYGPNLTTYTGILTAYRLHDNVKLGERAVQHCIELESDTAGSYSLLSGTYATVGKSNDVKKLRMGVVAVKH